MSSYCPHPPQKKTLKKVVINFISKSLFPFVGVLLFWQKVLKYPQQIKIKLFTLKIVTRIPREKMTRFRENWTTTRKSKFDCYGIQYFISFKFFLRRCIGPSRTLFFLCYASMKKDMNRIESFNGNYFVFAFYSLKKKRNAAMNKLSLGPIPVHCRARPFSAVTP